MKRAIVGGTFDPPHLAHLLAGEAAFRQLGVDLVTFIPAGKPWQKADSDVTEPRHRWAMTQLALTGIDYFAADDREVRRSGWTYTVDTLDSFSQDDVTLVLGADTAANLESWHRSGDVRKRARIAVVPRPQTSRQAVEVGVGADFTWLDMPEVQISGTEIRARVRAGKSIRFLVPEAVWEYVVSNDIYGTGGMMSGPK